MGDSAELMEITARTVSIARSMAVDYEQNRILGEINEMIKGRHLSPEAIRLIHEVRKIVRHPKA